MYRILFCIFLRYSCLALAIPFRRYDVSLAKITSKTMQYSPKSDNCHWLNVTQSKHLVMDRYFGQVVKRDQQCDVFCIQGIPAASMLYTTCQDVIKVDAFHLNEGMIVLCDAGPDMRSTFFARCAEENKRIDIRDARNRDEFLIL